MTNRGRAADLRERRSQLDTQRERGLISESEHALECLHLTAEYHGHEWSQDRWHEHTTAVEGAMERVQAESLASAREWVRAGMLDATALYQFQ